MIQLVMKIDAQTLLAQTRNETAGLSVAIVPNAQVNVEVMTQAGLGIKTSDVPPLDQYRLDAGCTELLKHSFDAVDMDGGF
jgi:hypothetical protein